MNRPYLENAMHALYAAAHHDMAGQTRTAHRFSRHSGLAPLRWLSHRTRLRAGESESGLSPTARSRSGCSHAWRGLAPGHLHFHSADGEHAAITRLGKRRLLYSLSLVDGQRARISLGCFQTHYFL